MTELVAYPGIGVSEYAWGYDWEGETRALCDPNVRAELDARGIELVSPSRVRGTSMAHDVPSKERRI